jgi:hypothetical protein
LYRWLKTTENYKKRYKRGKITENFNRLKIYRKDTPSVQYHSRVPVDAYRKLSNLDPPLLATDRGEVLMEYCSNER